MSGDVALYIHIPFCRRKCRYCSFVSYEYREYDIPLYLTALKAELTWRDRGEHIRSIYFGGGTPSLLSVKHLDGLLCAISSLFTVAEAAEVTIEANPGTISVAYVTDVRKLGVNRLSLGVQSLNDRELVLLGRIHTAAEAREAVNFARSSGFDNLSLDLIYGLPGQSLSDWRKTLAEVLDMAPDHLSLYALSLEDDTPLQQVIKQGYISGIDPDLSADQYELAEDMLAGQGYQHYEISNWARNGRECHHNMVYWQNMPYLGIGVAAHSYQGGHRLANTKDLDAYLTAFSNNAPPVPSMDEEIGLELQLAETVILGLRLCAGISIEDIKNRCDVDVWEHYQPAIAEMVDAGLLEHADGYLKLTRRGRLLSNEVFWRFLPG